MLATEAPSPPHPRSGETTPHTSRLGKAYPFSGFANPNVVGITGSAFAGKTHITACLDATFSDWKIPLQVFEIPAVIRSVILTDDGKIRRRLKRRCGGKKIFSGDEVDFPALWRNVLSDTVCFSTFCEIIIHPICGYLKQKIRPNGIVLIDSDFIAEAEMLEICRHQIIFVHADETSRASRMEKRRLDPEQIERRQSGLNDPRKKLDMIQKQTLNVPTSKIWDVHNNGDRIDLRQLTKLARSLRDHFQLN